jgi:hypothetical protein
LRNIDRSEARDIPQAMKMSAGTAAEINNMNRDAVLQAERGEFGADALMIGASNVNFVVRSVFARFWGVLLSETFSNTADRVRRALAQIAIAIVFWSCVLHSLARNLFNSEWQRTREPWALLY